MSPKQPSTQASPRLIVISAPSGAGKTTLCQMLLQEFPKICLSISATTRQKRPDEVDGKDYFFLSTAEFEAKKQRGDFAEWANVHGHWYGTPKAEIERRLKEGHHILFAIDVQGAESLLKIYGAKVLRIFISPPSVDELEKRLTSRKQDTAQSIETRLQNAYNELEWAKSFDYQILNQDLKKAYEELKRIYLLECL